MCCDKIFVYMSLFSSLNQSTKQWVKWMVREEMGFQEWKALTLTDSLFLALLSLSMTTRKEAKFDSWRVSWTNWTVSPVNTTVYQTRETRVSQVNSFSSLQTSSLSKEREMNLSCFLSFQKQSGVTRHFHSAQKIKGLNCLETQTVIKAVSKALKSKITDTVSI